ncbi:integrase [Actinomadura sp. 7K534]|nr:integrase [Actinomadura sp. 7K534]
MPPIRLHDLRHGAATLALAAEVELRVVQEMPGHSNIVLTADTYTSVWPEVAHVAAEKTAAYLLQAAGAVPGTTTRRPRRTPARRGGLVASRTRAGLVRHRAPSERPEPARPRTHARPTDGVRPRPAAVAA